MPRRQDVRNVAIIAHVDHGKTTLVDGLLSQTGSLRARGEVSTCIMDSKDQERERGITILAKICAAAWKGVRINIIDTPGHADFGGEVERVVRMADGCLLLVDAAEGVMPQTRFVLGKALACGLKPIVVVNKIDKPGCRPHEVVDEVFDLMVELGANDDQLDFPVVFGAGREGYMRRQPDGPENDLTPLLDIILESIPGPEVDNDAPLRLQISNIDYNDFVGRIGIGRIYAGSIRAGQSVVLVKNEGASPKQGRVMQLHMSRGIERVEVSEAVAGDIVQVTGLEGVDISATICDPASPLPLPQIPIDEPTIRMIFSVSTSPLCGREGRPLQSRELQARLFRESERNVAMRFQTTERPDVFEVHGRGVLHLSVLIEDMRREGSEFQVGPPRVIYHSGEDGVRLEPVDEAVIDVPEGLANRAMALMLERRAEVEAMSVRGGLQHITFTIPSRGLIGLRTQLLSATQGEATLHTVFRGYLPYRGDIPGRRNGAMVSICDGAAVGFAIFNLQDRGVMFVAPGDPLYEGLIVGEHCKEGDIGVNCAKEKKMTNVRSSGTDEAIRLVPPRRFSLEEALEWIESDEAVEVTPRSIRIRKGILNAVDRKRAAREAGLLVVDEE